MNTDSPEEGSSSAMEPGHLAGRRPGSPEPDGARRRFLWIYTAIAGSLLLRFSFFDFESGDYRAFLSRWYDHLVAHGRWTGLQDDFSDYPPLYLYMLSLSSLLPIPKLYAIKLISIIFDYLAAGFVYKIVQIRWQSGPVPLLAAGLVLFLPTVLFNSAVWGQCDVIYTSALLGTVYWVLKKRQILALCAFGVAAALKPQAIFLTPFLAGLFFCGRLSWKWCWVPLAVYSLCGLPAILAGKPVVRVLLHYAYQRNRPGLTSGATNWYQWITTGQGGSAPTGNLELFYTAGIVVTILVALCLIFMMQGKRPLSGKHLVSMALASVLLTTYLLPGMHERYFFPADILSIVYAFYVMRGWIVAVLVQFCSFFTYLPYLFRQEPVPRPILAIIMTVAIGIVIAGIARDLWEAGRKDSEGARRLRQ